MEYRCKSYKLVAVELLLFFLLQRVCSCILTLINIVRHSIYHVCVFHLLFSIHYSEKWVLRNSFALQRLLASWRVWRLLQTLNMKPIKARVEFYEPRSELRGKIREEKKYGRSRLGVLLTEEETRPSSEWAVHMAPLPVSVFPWETCSAGCIITWFSKGSRTDLWDKRWRSSATGCRFVPTLEHRVKLFRTLCRGKPDLTPQGIKLEGSSGRQAVAPGSGFFPREEHGPPWTACSTAVRPCYPPR